MLLQMCHLFGTPIKAFAKIQKKNDYPQVGDKITFEAKLGNPPSPQSLPRKGRGCNMVTWWNG